MTPETPAAGGVEPAHPLSAPQQAAEPLLRQLVPEAHDRRFLRVLLAVWLGLVAASVAAALLLDPIGAFGTGLVEPLVWHDADQKAALFLARQPRPQLLVLGSSHMMKVSPSALTRLTGRPAFNFSVSAARPEDMRAILRFAFANGAALDRVLIGVDAEMLRNDGPMGRGLAASHHLRRYAATGAPSRLASLGYDLLSGDTVLLALRSLRVNLLEGGRPPRQFAIQPDGFVEFLRWEAEAARAHAPPEERLRASIRDFRGWYASFDRLDPDRVQELRGLLAEARERGVQVDACLPPLHPRVLRALGRTTRFPQRRRDTLLLLRELEEQGLLRLHALDGVGDADGFYDGEHLDEASSTRLLERVYGPDTRRAVQ